MANYKVAVFHNILWAKYKGVVFSALNDLVVKSGAEVCFVQIAETESDRLGLAGVDLGYHTYPYKLLFKGAYDDVSSLRLIFSLFGEVVRNDADLIIIPGYHKIEYWSMLLACIFSGKKRAVFCDSTAYDRPSRFFKNLSKRLFFKFCDGYFGYGQRSRDYLISLGANPKNIFYRCQAAALPHQYTETFALASRLSSFDKLSPPRFLYAGRLSWEKGLDSLLSAFKLVLNEFPNAELVLVGAGVLRNDLELLSRSLFIQDRVEFVGSMTIDALALEYAKATCFVLPSRSEPWGLVVNEALSYGCPVVVSNVCGCVPELVIDNVTGFQFQVDDVHQLADRMISVAKDFVDHDLVAKHCIDHISSFSPKNAAQQIFDGCTTILEGRVS